MKESAFLVNIPRGKVIDEQTLIKALSLKKIKGVTFYVFREKPLPVSHPLNKLDNVILFPRCVGSTWKSIVSITRAAALTILDVIEVRRSRSVYSII
jgi:D-3-phosphoglycerate dehydrogenase